MITSCPLPSWAAVTGPGDVVAGGVVQTVTYLTTAIAVCSCGALLLTVLPHEAGAASALPRDVVAVCSVLAPAYQRTVLSIEAQRTSLSAVEPRPAWSAFAFPVVGAAEGPVVAVARVDAVGAPVRRGTRLRAVAADPPRITLTRSVNGVTGSIVGTGTDSRTVFSKSATGTHFIAEGACEARQAVTQACDVVAGPTAVHTLRARLAAAMPIKSRGADPLTGGASEPRCTLTDAVIRGARSPVFTVAGQGAVGAPATLSTHAVTVDT